MTKRKIMVMMSLDFFKKINGFKEERETCTSEQK